MPGRISHSSESLKVRFPEVYRDFFSKCTLVCSAPRSVGLVGEYVGYEALAMRQSLPIRTYVGLTPSRDRGFTVVEYVTFHPEEENFHEHIMESDIKDRIEEKLFDLLQQMFPSTTIRGFHVHILSELPLERALGGAGSLFAPLTVMLLLVHDILKKEHLDSWGKAPISELIAQTETKFDLTFRTIWKIETTLYYTASGISHFIPLVPSAVPILFTSKKSVDSEELISRVRNDEAVDFHQMIDQSHYWGARSNELFDKHIEWPLPFDWGIISTEQSRMVYESMFTTADVQEELHEVAREAVKIKERLLGKSFTGASPDFFTLCETNRSSQLWQYYIGFLSLLSFQALLKFKKIFERGSSKKHVSELFELLNKIHGTFYSFGLCTDRINRLVHLFHDRVADKIGADAVAVKMSSTARQGNIFFATTAPLVRPIIDDVIEPLNKDGQIKISLDYASWIDGYEEEGGVKIEQWLDRGIHSPLLDADAIQYVFWNKKGVQKTSASTRSDVLKKKHDLFFDCIGGQVFVAGEECTSKDLPSQKATVAIMEALLATEGHRLHNHTLPESGYAKYRNEFQGKITGPLSAVVKSRLKKDFLFKVEGTLTDFWVSVDPIGFDIGIVKKFV